MEQRLIDANALIDELRKAEEGSLAAAKIIQATEQYSAESITATSFSVVRDVVNDAPTIDPVKHGRWIGEGDGYADGEMVYDVWYCDQCDHTEETDDPDKLPKYCPNCGSRMDGGKP